MTDEPRAPGDLAPSPQVARALSALRGDPGPVELDNDRVRKIEAAVGVRLPDDILACFAAGVLADRCAMTLGGVVGHTGALREAGARGDLIGVARVEPGVILCVRKHERTLVCFDLHDRSERDHDLGAWLEAMAANAGDQPLRARLVAFQPESTLAGRRVRHATFGDGKALREIGTGPTRKVQVDFPGRGLKLLQARFLEFLD